MKDTSGSLSGFIRERERVGRERGRRDRVALGSVSVGVDNVWKYRMPANTVFEILLLLFRENNVVQRKREREREKRERERERKEREREQR